MKRLIFVLSVLLFSCIKENPQIIIENDTQIKFDSIKVFTTPNIPTIFRNVEPKFTLKGQINFDKTSLSDGGYTIQIFKDGKIYRQNNFGYYTNGRPLNRKFDIVIEPDTLKVSFK